MAIHPILKYPDPILLAKSREITAFDDGVRRLVADMIETVHAAPGVGLAANQIGVTLRVAVVDLSVGEDPSQLLILINPHVLSAEGSQVDEEGCLSIPGVTERVERAARVEVEAKDLDGGAFTVRGEGLLARALLHEIDHLDGILFPDRLSPLKRRLIRKKIQKLIHTGDWAGGES